MSTADHKQITSIAFWPQTAYCWFELILKIVLIFGGIGAVMQYLDIKHENRVKQTMEQLIRFNSDKLLNAQLNLNSAWEPHYKIIRIINNKQ